MILRRLGNKSKIAKEIQQYFPPHKIYIEPFFGAGGMFFNKPKAKYNIVNDIDSDVFNLFQVVSNKKNELEKAFYEMPIHSDLLGYWKQNKETEPIKKALRFLFLSNFTMMGGFSTMFNGAENPKKVFYENLDITSKLIFDVQFFNKDFRVFCKLLREQNNEESFIYADSPYLYSDTKQNTCYNMDTWKETDTNDLFNSLQETGCKFAMSEFDNEFIINQAKERKLNIIYIGERRNLKNKRTEILITNYQKERTLFD